MGSFDTTRRGFIKQCVIGGVAVYTAPMLWEMNPAYAASFAPDLAKEWKGQGKPKYRNDGLEKVTGQKIYGRDYRAVDMPGWPDQQGYGFILRCNKADHKYQGFDLSILPASARPSTIITAKELKRDKIELPPFFGEQMLLEAGQTPHYLGHAVAILLFDDFASFRLAKNKLQFNASIIQYAEKTAWVADSKNPYASWRIVREEGPEGASAEDAYSPLQDGLFFPNFKAHRPAWPTSFKENGSVSERGMYYADKIKQDFEKPPEGWHVLDQEYRTQFVDPMMMEPEAFNGWFDVKSKTLHTVLTSQSPHDFQEQAVVMLNTGPFRGKIKHLVVHSPYVGGGFGAKDHSIFPYYGLVASLYAQKPMLIANDRFEQFQSGLKRHPFTMKNKLAVDKETLKIQAMSCDMTVDGGGRANFTSAITMVGASAIQGIYYIPRNDILATAYPSHNPDCGSMRGFGTLQTMSAMETMINEVAGDLKVDPIAIRKANVMESGQRNTQGAIPNGALRYREMLDMAEQHATWKNRANQKAAFEKANPGKKYGVGFGIASKDYGTGAASPSAAVRIQPDGQIELDICFMEMGTGTNTSQALVVSEWLGSMADTVTLGEVEAWEAMQLIQTDNPYITSQERQDKMSRNPRWTPVIAMASAASMSSYYQTHATAAAARIVFEHGLWPAAVSIWSERYFNGRLAEPDFKDPSVAQWKDGQLSAYGYPPLSYQELARRAHDEGLVTGAMVHAFNRWAWTEAQFEIQGQSKNLPIDGLAIQYGKGASTRLKRVMNSKGYHLLDRKSVNYPKTALNNAMVTYYAPCATLAEIAVSEGSGEVEILSTHTWLEAGKVLVKELVEGQIEGGLVMGVGHALYEQLPPSDAGAGNGTWNLNRYQVPLAKHVGVWKQTHTLLPPLSPSDPSKGIGEVVMIPIVPALVEAVYQATGKRFRSLPMSAERIKEAIA